MKDDSYRVITVVSEDLFVQYRGPLQLGRVLLSTAWTFVKSLPLTFNLHMRLLVCLVISIIKQNKVSCIFRACPKVLFPEKTLFF